MKKIIVIIIFVVLLIVSVLFQQQIVDYIMQVTKGKTVTTSQESIASLFEINKTVRLKKSDSNSWDMADVNERLALADSLSTGFDSNAIIKFDDGSFFKLEENSLIVLDNPTVKEANLIELTMNKGTLQVKSASDKSKFKIKTGEATTVIKGKTNLGVRVNKDKTAEVWVKNGSAVVKKKSGEEFMVNENEHKQFFSEGSEAEQQYIFKDVIVEDPNQTVGNSNLEFNSNAQEATTGISRAQINKIITNYRKRINTCAKGQSVSRATVDITIANSGSVETASITNSDISDPNIQQCIILRMRAISFPSFKGASVTESIELVFE